MYHYNMLGLLFEYFEQTNDKKIIARDEIIFGLVAPLREWALRGILMSAVAMWPVVMLISHHVALPSPPASSTLMLLQLQCCPIWLAIYQGLCQYHWQWTVHSWHHTPPSSSNHVRGSPMFCKPFLQMTFVSIGHQTTLFFSERGLEFARMQNLNKRRIIPNRWCLR